MTPEERIAKLEGNVRTLGIWLVVVGVFAFFAFGFACKSYSQDKAAIVPTPREAIGWALGDIVTVPEADRPFQRYLWLPPWSTPDWIPATNFTINTAVSHSQVIQLGATIANGWMLRFDLRRLAPNVQKLAKLIEVWDGLAIDDPYFHVPEVNSKIRAAILAPHLRQPEAAALTSLSFSGGAVYRADWFVYKALSTLDEGIGGKGRYYDFLQVDKKPKAGTAQEAFLASYGLFEGESRKLGGDKRSLTIISLITDNQREEDILTGVSGGIGSITRDISSKDSAKTEKLVIRNLEAFEDSAREVIIQRPNGMLAYALFNAKGEFQDSVPEDIATDSTIPSSHKQLQPGISCIRCHGPHNGWQPLSNDLPKLIAAGVDVVGSLRNSTLTREQRIDQLAGRFGGDLDAPDGYLDRARRDHLTATFKITGGPRLGDADKKQSVVAKVSETIGKMYNDFRYNRVTSEQAALEAGYANATVKEILEPLTPGELLDPVKGAMVAGIPIGRAAFESIYSDLMLEVQQKAELRKEKK